MRRTLLLIVAAFTLSVSLPSLVPDARAYGQGKKEKKEKKKRPTLEYKKYRRTREVDVQMKEKRKAIREQLVALLKYEKDDKEKPALLFRLAENYFEEAMASFNQGQRLDDDLSKDPENERLRAEIERKKKEFRKVEDKWRMESIDLYRKIVNEYTNYAGRAQVLFYLASSLWDMEKFKEGLTTYRQMIKDYPNSKYVPDAYLAFGEYYFDKALLDKALMAYKKVAEYKESQVYPYALYKQGWCYYNLHEWDKAKEMFQSVIYLADMGVKSGRIEVRKEALKDFTLTYSQEGSATAAPRVFKRLAPKEAPQMLVNLAGMYFGDGQDKKAILLYMYMVKEKRCSAEVPFYQGRVVDCGSRVGDKRYTVKQVRQLVELFEYVAGCLKSPDARQKEKIKEARELAEQTLRRLASIWYKEAKETKQRDTFAYAQEMFGDYLDLFPRSPDAYDMRFAYAELLFHRLERYERAAVEYSKVVSRDLAWFAKHKKFPKKGTKDKKGRSAPGTYLCDAAYKAVLAHRELMKKERKLERRRHKKEKKSGPVALDKKVIPKGKRRFINAAEIYLDHCPSDQDICSVKFDIAKTYYDFSHFEEATKRFDEVVKDCTSNALAEYGANLVLDTFNLKQDWESLNKYARKYYANSTLMKHEKLKDFLKKLIPQIAFKRINMLASKPQYKQMKTISMHYKIGRAFIKFVKEFSKHELADEALFNSSVEFEKAERLDLARKARVKLIAEYPTSDLVPGTIFNLAENYERMTQFNDAAELYEKYAKTYKKMKGLGKAVSYKTKDKSKRRGRRKKVRPKKVVKKAAKQAGKEKRFEGNRRTWNSEDARDALMNAGIYREALRQYKEAIRDRLEFVDLFPRSDDAAQVYYSLGLLYEKMGQLKKSAEVFKRYGEDYFRANTDRAIAAHMKRAVLLGRMKKWRDAEKEMHTVVSLYRKHKRRTKGKDNKLQEAAEAAAHAEFILGESVYKDYIKFRFTKVKPKQLKRQLDEKGKRLKKVVRLYTEIAKLKQPEWAIASLYKLGRAYESFAETFYKAPLPKGLTPEQKDMYTQALREKGQPWEDKAVAHFGAAVKKGSELGFYSQFTRHALAKLQHYRPAEYPREDLGFRLSVVADTASQNPLLVASWDDVKKKPELLNKEPPLQTQRKESVHKTTPKTESTPPPAEDSSKDTASPKEPDGKPQPKAEPKAEPKEEPKEEPMPADPASDVDGEEPGDDFE
ncbi:MAG TPA: tetratricopeptide repeat protein [Myxococcota bacterium]|nr:tetratricopeptide repeat protein [Myxococcota bacterium]